MENTFEKQKQNSSLKSNLNTKYDRFLTLKAYKTKLEKKHLLPSLTSTIKETNNLNETKLSIFRSKSEITFNILNKTATKYQTIDEENNNIKTLVNFYHINGMPKISLNIKNMKKEILNKFNISNELNQTERESINNVIKIKNNESNFNSLRTINQNESMVNTYCQLEDEYFKDPFKSLKKIKLNKEIYFNFMNITNNKLTKSYNDEFLKVKNLLK